jgi:acyl carrier protein
MEQLEEELKVMIIETLKLEDVTPKDIDAAAPLFNGGLWLDSIDALELGVALQKRYRLRFDSNIAEIRRHFASVRTLAAFIADAAKSRGGDEKQPAE